MYTCIGHIIVKVRNYAFCIQVYLPLHHIEDKWVWNIIDQVFSNGENNRADVDWGVFCCDQTESAGTFVTNRTVRFL